MVDAAIRETIPVYLQENLWFCLGVWALFFFSALYSAAGLVDRIGNMPKDPSNAFGTRIGKIAQVEFKKARRRWWWSLVLDAIVVAVLATAVADLTNYVNGRW